jgi:hypothetical protein
MLADRASCADSSARTSTLRKDSSTSRPTRGTPRLAATLMLDGAGTGPGRVSSRCTGDLVGAGVEERAGTWVDALQHSPGIGFDAPD